MPSKTLIIFMLISLIGCANEEITNDNYDSGITDSESTNKCGPVNEYKYKRITNDPARSECPLLVQTEEGFGIAWIDTRNTCYEIYFAVLDPYGNKTTDDIKIATINSDMCRYTSSSPLTPALVATNFGFGLSWSSRGKSYLTLLDKQGNKINEIQIFRDKSIIYPSMVWTGEKFGIVYCDFDYDTDSREIYSIQLDNQGNKLGNPVKISNNAHSWRSHLVYADTNFGMIWLTSVHDDSDYQRIYFAKLDNRGRKITQEILISEASPCRYTSLTASLIWTGNNFAISWTKGKTELANENIYFILLDQNGNKKTNELQITNNKHFNKFPSLAWSGNEYGLAWSQESFGRKIYLIRLDANGRKIGTLVPIDACEGVSLNMSDYPSLVWTGQYYAIGFQDERDAVKPIYYYTRNSEIYFTTISFPD